MPRRPYPIRTRAEVQARWNRVKAALSRGLSQTDVARVEGVTPQSVQRIAHETVLRVGTGTYQRVLTPLTKRELRALVRVRRDAGTWRKAYRAVLRAGFRGCYTTFMQRRPAPVRAQRQHVRTKFAVAGRMEVDFGHVKIWRGRSRPLFVAVMRQERWLFARLCPRESREWVTRCVLLALRRCPVPVDHIACDQGKAFVSTQSWLRPKVWQPHLRAFPSWRPCQPGRPQQKCQVERDVGVLQRALAGDREQSLKAANRAIRREVRRLNRDRGY